ncbi:MULTISPECIES: GGDEF domain-containing protein [Gammaproteobacteria]|nr:GGDEF domain-containing protein [Shewanella baltica]AVT49489.1 GGDEF domain-containing protein [Shewanella baltica]
MSAKIYLLITNGLWIILTSIPIKLRVRTSTFFSMLKSEATPAYLQKKMLDHRLYTTFLILFFIPLTIVNYFFEYNDFNLKSDNLLSIHVLYLWLVIPAYVLYKNTDYKINYLTLILVVLLSSIHSALILNIMNANAIVTVSEIVTFPFFIFFILIGVSLYLQLITLMVAIFIPLFLHFEGAIEKVSSALYLQVMYQSSFSAIFIMVIFSWSYHNRYYLEIALEKSSKTDSLTGLANRRHFNNFILTEVTRCTRTQQNCSLILLDIDFFKRINDKFGHPSGDRVICALANICVENSRKIDLVARLGGEEFAIVMPNTNVNEAYNLAERIRVNVENTIVLSDSNEDINWTVSLGISQYSAPVSEELFSEEAAVESLIQMTDSALYKAKSNGRNQIMIT